VLYQEDDATGGGHLGGDLEIGAPLRSVDEVPLERRGNVEVTDHGRLAGVVGDELARDTATEVLGRAVGVRPVARIVIASVISPATTAQTAGEGHRRPDADARSKHSPSAESPRIAPCHGRR